MLHVLDRIKLVKYTVLRGGAYKENLLYIWAPASFKGQQTELYTHTSPIPTQHSLGIKTKIRKALGFALKGGFLPVMN